MVMSAQYGDRGPEEAVDLGWPPLQTPDRHPHSTLQTRAAGGQLSQNSLFVSDPNPSKRPTAFLHKPEHCGRPPGSLLLRDPDARPVDVCRGQS